MRLMCCRRFCHGEILPGYSMAIGEENFHVACYSSEMKERLAAQKQEQAEVAKNPPSPWRPAQVGENWPYQDRHFQPA